MIIPLSCFCKPNLCLNQYVNNSNVVIRVVNTLHIQTHCSISYFVGSHFNSLVSSVLEYYDSSSITIPANISNIRVTVFNVEKVPPGIICIKNYKEAKNVDILISGTPTSPTCVESLSKCYNLKNNIYVYYKNFN